jgi:hypothetical protein
MKIYAGGREIEVPTDEQGKVNVGEVRRTMNVPDGRLLIQQKPTGENVVLPNQGTVQINPYERFMESPIAKRG